MPSGESLNVDEMSDLIRDKFSEEGIGSVQVSHEFTSQRLDRVCFYIRKIDSQRNHLSFKTAFVIPASSSNDGSIRKKIIVEAERLAREMKDRLVETFEWDSRCVEVSEFDGGWARCCECDTEVKLPNLGGLFGKMSETSDPALPKFNLTNNLDNMDEYQKILFKLYLIGTLRKRCDNDCRNNKYNTQNSRVSI